MVTLDVLVQPALPDLPPVPEVACEPFHTRTPACWTGAQLCEHAHADCKCPSPP